MSQTITRAGLQEIYKIVCSGWQTKIDAALTEQKFNKEIIVEDSIISKAFSEADVKQRKILEKWFSTPKNLTDRIKSFQDVLDIAGKTLDNIIVYKQTKLTNKQKSVNAYCKLQLIENILNNHHKFNFADSSEYKYYPYFQYKAPGGWVCADAVYNSRYYGSGPTYFTSRELAKFAGETFLDIYKDFMDRY
jgi:hypothetical protein